jgi:hypothetical protein
MDGVPTAAEVTLMKKSGGRRAGGLRLADLTHQIGRVLVAGSKQSRGRWNKHYLQFINGSPVLSK